MADSPPGSPGSAGYPASSLSNPNHKPARKRGVSVVSGLGKDHVYKGKLDGDWDLNQSSKDMELGNASFVTSEASSGGRKKREPIGMKKRDYSFLAYHHSDDADHFDDLIADYKGISRNALHATDADADEQRVYLKSLPRDNLLKVMLELMPARKAAQDSIPYLVQEATEINAENEAKLEKIRPKATAVREKQLELQLKELELQKYNLNEKTKLQQKTKKLREARETFKAHVEGLEDSWKAYLEERGHEKEATIAAREGRIRQFREHIKVLQEKKEKVAEEIETLRKKRDANHDKITTQNRHISKLSNALGMEPDKTLLAEIPEIPQNSVTETASHSSSSHSGSYTSSYTSESSSHCSTCDETLASTYVTDASGSWESSTEASGASHANSIWTTTRSSGTYDTMASVFTKVDPQSDPLRKVSMVSTQDALRNTHGSQRLPQQQQHPRRRNPHSPNLLKMVHTALKQDFNDPKHLQAYLAASPSQSTHRRRPSDASVPQKPEVGLHPERGFAFPFV